MVEEQVSSEKAFVRNHFSKKESSYCAELAATLPWMKKQGSATIRSPWGIGLYRHSYRSTIDSLISSELPRSSGAYMAAAVVGRAL